MMTCGVVLEGTDTIVPPLVEGASVCAACGACVRLLVWLRHRKLQPPVAQMVGQAIESLIQMVRKMWCQTRSTFEAQDTTIERALEVAAAKRQIVELKNRNEVLATKLQRLEDEKSRSSRRSGSCSPPRSRSPRR